MFINSNILYYYFILINTISVLLSYSKPLFSIPDRNYRLNETYSGKTNHEIEWLMKNDRLKQECVQQTEKGG